MPRQAAAVAQAPRPPWAPLTMSSSPEDRHRAATRSGLSNLIEPANLLPSSNICNNTPTNAYTTFTMKVEHEIILASFIGDLLEKY